MGEWAGAPRGEVGPLTPGDREPSASACVPDRRASWHGALKRSCAGTGPGGSCHTPCTARPFPPRDRRRGGEEVPAEPWGEGRGGGVGKGGRGLGVESGPRG